MPSDIILRVDAHVVKEFAERLHRLVLAQNDPELSPETREVVKDAVAAVERATGRKFMVYRPSALEQEVDKPYPIRSKLRQQ